jgi:hypothetical protein
MESLGLDLLALELCAGVIEVEQDATLMEFLDEQLGAFAWRGFCTTCETARDDEVET